MKTKNKNPKPERQLDEEMSVSSEVICKICSLRKWATASVPEV